MEAQAEKRPAPASHLQTHKSWVDFVGSHINFYHEGSDSNFYFLVMFLAVGDPALAGGWTR